jgi:hypothetical protein
MEFLVVQSAAEEQKFPDLDISCVGSRAGHDLNSGGVEWDSRVWHAIAEPSRRMGREPCARMATFQGVSRKPMVWTLNTLIVPAVDSGLAFPEPSGGPSGLPPKTAGGHRHEFASIMRS